MGGKICLCGLDALGNRFGASVYEPSRLGSYSLQETSLTISNDWQAAGTTMACRPNLQTWRAFDGYLYPYRADGYIGMDAIESGISYI